MSRSPGLRSIDFRYSQVPPKHLLDDKFAPSCSMEKPYRRPLLEHWKTCTCIFASLSLLNDEMSTLTAYSDPYDLPHIRQAVHIPEALARVPRRMTAGKGRNSLLLTGMWQPPECILKDGEHPSSRVGLPLLDFACNAVIPFSQLILRPL